MTQRTTTQIQQTPTTSPLSRGGILQRQCASCGQHTIAGGECSECAKKKNGLQRKLTIGDSNDPLEQEADRVADQVMISEHTIQPQIESEEGTERVQRKDISSSAPSSMQGGDVPAIVYDVLQSPGQPIDLATRAFMEPRFGHDFSQVRVHTDTSAAKSAKTMDAQAYTVGSHVVFDSNRYTPGTIEGRHLLAHELTHVLQQSTTSIHRRLQSAEGSQPISSSSTLTIQRQPRGRGPSSPPHPSPTTPTLGSCRPVQDDLRPTAPWSDLQRGYRARCASAAADAESQVEHTLDDILHGRMPRRPHIPDPRSSVDCACAFGTPSQAAWAAMPVLAHAGPLAASLYYHFLEGSGTPMPIDVAAMIVRSGGVREKIRKSIAHDGMSGTTRLEQSDYRDREFQFAYGAIDCVQWVALSPRRSWRSDPTTQIRISMLDYYEFHPARRGVSQCAHAACVELVARGSAKNFWTRGESIVTWGQLQVR